MTRRVLDSATGQRKPVEEVLAVDVRPGWKEGTRVTFTGKGDEMGPPGAPPQDLVFVIKESPHPRCGQFRNSSSLIVLPYCCDAHGVQPYIPVLLPGLALACSSCSTVLSNHKQN